MPRKNPPPKQPSSKTKTKRKPTGPRRAYLNPEIIKMANLAGCRALDAKSIAEEIGNTSAAKVRSIMHKHGVSMLRKGIDDDFFVMHWLRRDTALLTKFAHEYDLEPMQLAVFVLRILMSEPTLFGNLVDELKQHEEARISLANATRDQSGR